MLSRSSACSNRVDATVASRIVVSQVRGVDDLCSLVLVVVSRVDVSTAKFPFVWGSRGLGVLVGL